MVANPRAEARSRRLSGLPERVTTLIDSHRRVLDAWFADGCRSKRAAVRAAGLDDRHVTRIFGHPDVKREIDMRRDRIARKWEEVTEERIIEEYRRIAFSNLGDLLEIQEDGSAWLDMSGITEDQKSALAEYHVETYQVPGAEDETGYTVKKSRIKFHDKKAALDSLARIRGMFKDKLEVSVGLSLTDKVQQARQRLQESKTIEGEVVT